MGERLPLFPLGTVLFPGMLLPLRVFEERYRRLVRDRANVDPIFGVVLIRRGREVADQPEVQAVGTAASLVGAGRYPDGRYDLVVRGGRRFRILAGDWSAGYLTAEIDWLDEPLGGPPHGLTLADLVAQVAQAQARLLDVLAQVTGSTVGGDEPGDDPAAYAYAVCSRLPVAAADRQRLLEAATTTERLVRLRDILRRERDLLLATGAGGAGVERPGSRFSAN